MSRDPIKEEVRQIRQMIEAECEDDAQKYYEHIQQFQEKYRNRLVQRKPKPSLKRRTLAA
jgi:hypothetical protein